MIRSVSTTIPGHASSPVANRCTHSDGLAPLSEAVAMDAPFFESDVVQEILALEDNAGRTKRSHAGRLWHSHRHHVTQALVGVLTIASDSLNLAPFAKAVLNGAISAVTTLEVFISPRPFFSLPNTCADTVEESSSVPRCRAVSEAGGIHPAPALSGYSSSFEGY